MCYTISSDGKATQQAIGDKPLWPESAEHFGR